MRVQCPILLLSIFCSSVLRGYCLGLLSRIPLLIAAAPPLFRCVRSSGQRGEPHVDPTPLIASLGHVLTCFNVFYPFNARVLFLSHTPNHVPHARATGLDSRFTPLVVHSPQCALVPPRSVPKGRAKGDDSERARQDLVSDRVRSGSRSSSGRSRGSLPDDRTESMEWRWWTWPAKGRSRC